MRTPRPARGDDALAAFWEAARSYPLLDAAEERKLGGLVQAGLQAAERLAQQPDLDEPDLDEAERAELERQVEIGREARKRFVCGNLRLVGTTTRPFRGQGLELCDLAQEGVLGLLRAVERFDPSLGYKFSTYAVWWIRQAVLDAIAKTGRSIRLPVRRRELARQSNAVEQRLTVELGRAPTLAEIADELGVDPAAIAFSRELTVEIASLDTLVGTGPDGERAPLASLIPADAPTPEEDLIARERGARVDAAISRLDRRSAAVVRTRYGLDGGEPRTLVEAGRIHGIGSERARQMQRLAALRLRDLLDPDELT